MNIFKIVKDEISSFENFHQVFVSILYVQAENPGVCTYIATQATLAGIIEVWILPFSMTPFGL